MDNCNRGPSDTVEDAGGKYTLCSIATVACGMRNLQTPPLKPPKSLSRDAECLETLLNLNADPDCKVPSAPELSLFTEGENTGWDEVDEVLQKIWFALNTYSGVFTDEDRMIFHRLMSKRKRNVMAVKARPPRIPTVEYKTSLNAIALATLLGLNAHRDFTVMTENPSQWGNFRLEACQHCGFHTDNGWEKRLASLGKIWDALNRNGPTVYAKLDQKDRAYFDRFVRRWQELYKIVADDEAVELAKLRGDELADQCAEASAKADDARKLVQFLLHKNRSAGGNPIIDAQGTSFATMHVVCLTRVDAEVEEAKTELQRTIKKVFNTGEKLEVLMKKSIDLADLHLGRKEAVKQSKKMKKRVCCNVM